MLLTAKKLAKPLDVHTTTIRRAYRTKRIPYECFYKLYFRPREGTEHDATGRPRSFSATRG